MNELDLLIQQKKDIEKRIKELRNSASVIGSAKIDVEHYATGKPDRHYLAIFYKPLGDGRPKWQTIFSSNDRKEVVDEIPNIVKCLQGLYEANKGRNKQP